jgi:acyl-homoserine lactone acylase PvdQ
VRRPQRNIAASVRVPNAELLVAWVTLLSPIAWELFATLTFDPKRVFPVGRERAEKEALRWCELVGYTFRRPSAWVMATERSRQGLWHAHALLVGVPQNLFPLPEVWQARNGHIDVRSVTNSPGAILYTTEEAALTGTLVLSDTLKLYRERVTAQPRATLYPKDICHGSGSNCRKDVLHLKPQIVRNQ